MTLSESRRLVFISHSGEDTWVARQIAREVESRGAQPFLDEANIDVGADFEEDIRAFLDKADELLALMTPWSLQRPWVWAEVGAAWLRGIPIVVVLHGVSVNELQAMSSVPVFLKKRDMIRLNDIGQYLEQLSARVAEGRAPDE
jgi:hypothetical protein